MSIRIAIAKIIAPIRVRVVTVDTRIDVPGTIAIDTHIDVPTTERRV